MAKYTYEEGQRVYFNLDGKIKGWARIRGSATEEMPSIGRSWIIEVDEPTPFDKEVYPFSHITAFSCQLDTEEFDAGESTWNKELKNKGVEVDEAPTETEE